MKIHFFESQLYKKIQNDIYRVLSLQGKLEFGNVVYIVRFMRISQVGGKIRRGDAHPPPIAECNSSASALQSTKKIVDSSAVVSRMTDEFKIAEISAPENKNSNLEKNNLPPRNHLSRDSYFWFLSKTN